MFTITYPSLFVHTFGMPFLHLLSFFFCTCCLQRWTLPAFMPSFQLFCVSCKSIDQSQWRSQDEQGRETFEGENFRKLVKNTIFAEKTFADCLAFAAPKGATPPKFLRGNFCEQQNFSPSKLSSALYSDAHNTHLLGELGHAPAMKTF